MLKPSRRKRTQTRLHRCVGCKFGEQTILVVLSREVAPLVSEMSAIHSENRLYWESGSAATREARAEYQRRQDRLEEIRAALQSIHGTGKTSWISAKDITVALS